MGLHGLGLHGLRGLLLHGLRDRKRPFLQKLSGLHGPRDRKRRCRRRGDLLLLVHDADDGSNNGRKCSDANKRTHDDADDVARR